MSTTNNVPRSMNVSRPVLAPPILSAAQFNVTRMQSTAQTSTINSNRTGGAIPRPRPGETNMVYTHANNSPIMSHDWSETPRQNTRMHAPRQNLITPHESVAHRPPYSQAIRDEIDRRRMQRANDVRTDTFRNIPSSTASMHTRYSQHGQIEQNSHRSCQIAANFQSTFSSRPSNATYVVSQPRQSTENPAARQCFDTDQLESVIAEVERALDTSGRFSQTQISPFSAQNNSSYFTLSHGCAYNVETPRQNVPMQDMRHAKPSSVRAETHLNASITMHVIHHHQAIRRAGVNTVTRRAHTVNVDEAVATTVLDKLSEYHQSFHS